jgi:RimJ/RimL family protein N-acetyltransferase
MERDLWNGLGLKMIATAYERGAYGLFHDARDDQIAMRHFTVADLAPFMAYRNDPEVAKYQGWEGISEPEARAFLQEQKEVQPGVPGQWFQIGIELKETGILVGDCALKIEEHDERQAEIGSWLIGRSTNSTRN